MAETIKERAELLVQYPDNITQDISAQDLRDLVVSIDLYAEIFRSGTGNQNLGGMGAVLQWDANGQSFEVTPNMASNRIDIVHNGLYDVRFEGSVEIEKLIDFVTFIRVNSVNIREIGTLAVKDDSHKVSFSLGALLTLTASDQVEIFVDPSAAGADFDMRIGSRFTVKRMLG